VRDEAARDQIAAAMRRARQGRARWLTPVVAAVLVLPASYFGVNAALEHLGGGEQAAATEVGCQSMGCGASPAAAAPMSTASPASAPATPARAKNTPKPQVRPAKPRRDRTSAPATPRPSTPAAKPSPTTTATPPPAPPPVTAAYQEQNGWPGGFMGNFTVLDHGSQPVGGWKLTITLPGDMVTGVFGADWSQHGDDVVLTPEPGMGPLEPGVAQTITIVADGSSAAPASCTLDGGACT
jgi:Cellulose binding domain